MKTIEKTILLPVIVVFCAVMTVVAISFTMSLNNADKAAGAAAAEYSEQTIGLIKDRLNIFEETLHAGVGLFAGRTSISSAQFGEFINTSAVLERYSGAQSVGYVKIVEGANIGTFSDNIRSKENPTFTIWPEGRRAIYAPLIYVEPRSDSNKQAIGYDIYSDPDRSKTANIARDTGRAAITDVVQSIIDQENGGQSFVMYIPQYKHGLPTATVDQRRAAIEGFMFMGFRINTFVESVIPSEKAESISFKITMGTSKEEFYTAPDYDDITNRGHHKLENSLDVGGNVLNFSFAYDKNSQFSTGDSRPTAILIFGLVAAILIAGAVWLILRGKANELLLEQERGINEAKDNLLSLASHQLRTPATGVKQYLGLLIQGFAGEVTEQQQQLLEKAYAGNERQLKTINDVLYLARLGSGRIVLSKSTFLMRDLIKDIVRELGDEVRSRHHRVTVNVPKRKKQYYGDAHMIRMAVENLITNALKYTRDGGKISIILKYDKNNMRISVKDNGIGIEQDQQDRLFEQFERIDNDLSIAVGGSGIGLYVVRNIAGMHDGHVEVVSEIGHGSTFTLVLPHKRGDK